MDRRQHFSVRGSASSLLTSRFSKHPERYLEIFRVLRKYELHHVVAGLGMSHQHEGDLELPSANGYHEDGDQGVQLARALEELGPCLIKLGQFAEHAT